MDELFDFLMANCIVNDKGEIEIVLSKLIENWDLSDLYTTNGKGV